MCVISDPQSFLGVAGHRCVPVVNAWCRRPVLAAWWRPRSQLGGRALTVTADRYWGEKNKKQTAMFGCCCPVSLPSLSDCGKHTSFMLTPSLAVQRVIRTTTATTLLSVSGESSRLTRTQYIPLYTFQIIKKAPPQCLYPRFPDTVLSVSAWNHQTLPTVFTSKLLRGTCTEFPGYRLNLVLAFELCFSSETRLNPRRGKQPLFVCLFLYLFMSNPL